MNDLALSLTNQYNLNRAILAKPISTLARMSGLCVDDVYDKLIPELANKDLGEQLRFAEVGLHYATVIDRNRLREELGPKFIIALEMIINSVRSGLDSKENWIKRKAMNLHASLIDEQAEKQRFVETLITDKKIEMLAESKKNINKLEAEITEFEQNENGVFEIVANG